MSVIVIDKEISIIDRSLMAITKKEFAYGELIKFFENLKKLGVDFFEIDEIGFHAIKEILPLERFILRVEDIKQLQLCYKNNIEYVVVSESNLEVLQNLQSEDNKRLNIILEIDHKVCQDMEYLISVKELIKKNDFFNIRICNINNCFLDDFLEEFKDYSINVTASDKLHMATAVGFQSALKGVDSITTAFCGKDSKEDTTALEEFLVGLKVITDAVVQGEINLLALMGEQYEKLTFKQLSWNKPIVGKNVFKYESGVHAMGIDKNPETYEPFRPELVGQKRRLAIGKHSSRNSIHLKLVELGKRQLFSEQEVDIILMEVKRISVIKKMEMSDEELIDICSRIEACRNV
ncbi:MAG: hypothetical protein AB6733_21120 [Clostridiaceae bacterium]